MGNIDYPDISKSGGTNVAYGLSLFQLALDKETG